MEKILIISGHVVFNYRLFRSHDLAASAGYIMKHRFYIRYDFETRKMYR